ncbi:uncharacterized protein LOC62_05G006833 [Vanrija pseudolonga]|uniref:Transmembrane protein n=1 Tax=Vanrija pseudolonga TaxID=143232 RepID=A0AAF0YGB0_9TREE|nr:hypothetical protein LOC62_05G006833 [Vanrija pseudolonga]
MGYLRSLLFARTLFILTAGALAVAVAGLSGSALVQLQQKRKLAKSLSAKLVATDVIGVTGTFAGAAGFAVLVAFFSEFILWREKRKRQSNAIRFFNEFLLAFSALALLGGCIAGTIIILHHQGKVTMAGIPESVVQGIVKNLGYSLAYKDYRCFPALICAWICFGFVFINLILVILTGLHYRKLERQGVLEGDGTDRVVTEKPQNGNHLEH